MDYLPNKLKELKIYVNNKISLDKLPNFHKLTLIYDCKVPIDLDFLLNSLEYFSMNYNFSLDELNNLPNSIKILKLVNVKNVIIHSSVLDLDLLNCDEVIIPLQIKKLRLNNIKHIIFLDGEYNFEEVDIMVDKSTKITNLSKNLKIEKSNDFDIENYQIKYSS